MSDQRAYEVPTYPCLGCGHPVLPAAQGICGDCRHAVSEWIDELRSEADWNQRQHYDAEWLEAWCGKQTVRLALLRFISDYPPSAPTAVPTHRADE